VAEKKSTVNVVVILELILGAQENCGLTVEEASNYPHCTGKMNVITALFIHNFRYLLK